MRRIVKKMFFLLFSALLTGMSCSCQEAEKTKTILLPEKTSLDSGAINILNIQEYSYEAGPAEEQIAVNNRGNLCLLFQPEEGYLFQEIDLSAKNILHEIEIKDNSISNIRLAPGGRYISYEIVEKEAQWLVVLSTENEQKAVLHHWNNLKELYMYDWSGDGNSLFSWEDGRNHEKDEFSEWHIRRYDLGESLPETESKRLMKGSGYAWRKVLPNQDGTQIFVREEYVENGGERNWLIGDDLITEGQYTENAESNGQIDTDTGCYPINYMPLEINWPIKFSPKGLYVMDTEGNLCLIPNFKEQSGAKIIMPYNNIAMEICEKGDHIFFIEEDTSGQLQLCGIRIQNGIIGEKQILYKNMDAEAFNMAISTEDTAVFVQLCKFLEDESCRFTVIALEY